MPSLGMNFDPGRVLFGGGAGQSQKPYINTGNTAAPIVKPYSSYPGAGASTTTSTTPGAPAPGNVIGPESIRATGTGPYDAAYRQNLATYAGGQFSRPGGSMSFNPTNPATFPGMPTGGGSAPVLGMPQSLLDIALGGQPFSYSPPPAPSQQAPNLPQMQDWMNQFLSNGRGYRAALE